MAKRGYKLQELVAHSDNVNCVSIGKKAGRRFVTGGDDHQVRVWSVGKPTSLMSLCGLTSPVKSVAFDSAEVLVAAGASTGMIKLWDLQEAKIVRTLTGHKANCSAVEFHPFGEFFASGSLDTYLKIWDTRKKGCMHTYKGHTKGIGIIKFSPDGRWVVSGGLDNSVKIWDLTAGKLLRDFKSHDGHIRAIDFHPLEFLLATGSADKTVKFWDLETFELIGASRPEASGVRAMTFHPDGKTLFCGLEDSLKVYSWEPIIRHDTIDMGWSTLGDLCIHDDKLLGCAFYCNSVGVWAADISLIEPYRAGIISEQNPTVEQKYTVESRTFRKQENEHLSSLRSRTESPDSGTREKTIYVVSCEHSESLKKADSNNKVVPSESKDYDDVQSKKRSATAGVYQKSSVNGNSVNKSLLVPNFVPRDSSDEKKINVVAANLPTVPASTCIENGRSPVSTKDSAAVKVVNGVSVVPGRTRSLVEKFERREVNSSSDLATPVPSNQIPEADKKVVTPKSQSLMEKKEPAKDFISLKEPLTLESTGMDSVKLLKKEDSVKLIKREDSSHSHLLGTEAVQTISTKELLQARKLGRYSIQGKESEPPKSESFTSQMTEEELSTPEISEKESLTPQVSESESLARLVSERESLQSGRNSPQPQISGRESPEPPIHRYSIQFKESEPKSELFTPQMTEEELSTPEISEKESLTPQVSESESLAPLVSERESLQSGRNSPQPQISGRESPEPPIHRRQSPKLRGESPQTRISRRGSPQLQAPKMDSSQMSGREPSQMSGREPSQMSGREPSRPHRIRRESPIPLTSRREFSFPNIPQGDTRKESLAPKFLRRESSIPQKSRRESVSQISRRESSLPQISRRELYQPNRAASFMTRTLISDGVLAKSQPSRKEFSPSQQSEVEWRDAQVVTLTHMNRAKSGMDDDHTLSEREFRKYPHVLSDKNVAEVCLQDHDIFVSTLRSRLTKLQVVHHFWERNDIKGAINSLKKLPDQSVQADVVSVLTEKMEILNLDFFSCLLPVLVELLDSTTERHITVSLELLVKLVAVFGPIIFATALGPPSVGVDLHAEERREWCNMCFTQLQKVQQMLPPLIRRGGVVARSAQELNLVLQAT